MPLRNEDIDDYEEMMAEAAEKEAAAARKLLGLPDSEVELDGRIHVWHVDRHLYDGAARLHGD